jgi:hypothetical protein
MTDKLVVLENKEIENRIFTLRGVHVMLDKDLAVFYQVKPIRLREQITRNSMRFPEDFMFQLTEIEAEAMVSQNAIPMNILANSHDHFLIIDQKELYHLGASLKDLGKKLVVSEVEPWFAFSKMDSLTYDVLAKLK